jgi:hemoglobin
MTNAFPERVTAPSEKKPVHPAITFGQIDLLVERFYERVWADDRLGPIFEARVGERRPMHLEKMKRFWTTLLLKRNCYEGRPYPAHMKLSEVEEGDFSIWISHFETTTAEIFDPEAAAEINLIARRIARSFWLGMFGGLFGEGAAIAGQVRACPFEG